ncbi:alpha/beta hydrolase [Streptomyces stelliscabiei]|uniref:alpha/beta fold hydrolase n=1 Tax=Streptomyces TaxID=1883 RepID=UPI0015CEFF55|nr:MULTISPECIES: alpha/beta hydrolase [Streptomyces]MDX2522072.1 alpha/beta hydrolase [Streptomyces stelliscabiei]
MILPGTPLKTPQPAETAPSPGEALVRTHQWQGFSCESRTVRAASAPCFPPVLLIGGAFQRKESWGRCEEVFLKSMDVFTVDPPGWGAADLLPETYGVDFLADAVCHMLDECGTRLVNVLAGSYGSAIAYEIARRYPDRVGRVVLVGTMTAIPDHAQAAMRRTLKYLAAGHMETYAHATVDLLMTPERLADIPNGTRVRTLLLRRIANLSEAEAHQMYTNTLRLLTHQALDTSQPPRAPVLTVTGEYDSFTTPELCRQMAAACADSWYAEIRDADHMLILERTAETADLITRFLAGQPLDGLPYCRSVERVSPTLTPPTAEPLYMT